MSRVRAVRDVRGVASTSTSSPAVAASSSSSRGRVQHHPASHAQQQPQRRTFVTGTGEDIEGRPGRGHAADDVDDEVAAVNFAAAGGEEGAEEQDQQAATTTREQQEQLRRRQEQRDRHARSRAEELYYTPVPPPVELVVNATGVGPRLLRVVVVGGVEGD